MLIFLSGLFLGMSILCFMSYFIPKNKREVILLIIGWIGMIIGLILVIFFK